jgi:hypothetical protein
MGREYVNPEATINASNSCIYFQDPIIPEVQELGYYNYWYYYPQAEPFKNTTAHAFLIAQKLVEKKIVKLTTVKQFLELVDSVRSIL